MTNPAIENEQVENIEQVIIETNIEIQELPVEKKLTAKGRIQRIFELRKNIENANQDDKAAARKVLQLFEKETEEKMKDKTKREKLNVEPIKMELQSADSFNTPCAYNKHLEKYLKNQKLIARWNRENNKIKKTKLTVEITKEEEVIFKAKTKENNTNPNQTLRIFVVNYNNGESVNVVSNNPDLQTELEKLKSLLLESNNKNAEYDVIVDTLKSKHLEEINAKQSARELMDEGRVMPKFHKLCTGLNMNSIKGLDILEQIITARIKQGGNE